MYTLMQFTSADLTPDFLDGFKRLQFIRKKWYNLGGEWHVFVVNEKYDWDSVGRERMLAQLRESAKNGALLVGAKSLKSGKLVGFGALECEPGGKRAQYANISALMVDLDWRGMGIGTKIFMRMVACAKTRGVERLFVSAFPAADTVEFFESLGFTDATETVADFVGSGDDRCMEYIV